MTRYALAMTALDEIKRLAAEARAKHPAITDDLLLDGGTVFYMNKEVGTEFDWTENGRPCESFTAVGCSARRRSASFS